MRIVLARIDDRYIHGQVTVGWIQKLRPDRVILANNEIAADPWQSKVYRSSVPPAIEVSILGTSQAVAALSHTSEFGDNHKSLILITGSPADMHFIHRHGTQLADVNIGGMHFAQGKKEMLPFVYVDAQDLQVFRAFLRAGTRIWAQQVPGAKATPIDWNLVEEMEDRF